MLVWCVHSDGVILCINVWRYGTYVHVCMVEDSGGAWCVHVCIYGCVYCVAAHRCVNRTKKK